MTEERKLELARKLMTDDLTESDRMDLHAAVKEDERFREELRFDIGFAEAMERERYNRVEEARKSNARKKKWRIGGMITVIILILTALTYFVYNATKSPHPFTPEEGMDLMQEVLAASKQERRIGVNAGSQTWPELLAVEPLRQENLVQARKQLLDIIARDGRCDDTEAAYFLGVIELYIYRDYKTAEQYLRCMDEDPDYPYPEDAAIPLTLTFLGQSDLAAAAERFNSSGFSYNRLPAHARKLISTYNEL